MIDVPNILRELVEGFTETIKINSYTIDGSVYTASVCNTSYLSPKMLITVNGENAKVISIGDKEVKFKFISAIPSEITEITTDSFSFFHGTRVSTNNELIEAPKIDKQYFVWLPNGYDVEEKSTTGYTINFTIYALEIFNPDWKYMDHHDQVMYPLQTYVMKLMDKFEKSPFVYKKKNKGIIKHYADFGVLTRSGAEEKIFDQDLSGVGYQLSFDLLDSVIKKCCK